MELDTKRFEIRIAASDEDIAAAQRLRYRVFVEEMGAPAASADHARRLEKDAFDPFFDHLILIDRATPVADPLDRVAAVYRLLPGDRARAAGGFYSASEYDLSRIEALGRKTVELGRSCVAAPYRGGIAMHLMWNALAEYVLSREIEILFGVASFHGTDPDAIAPALSWLHHHHLAPDDLRVRARPEGFVDMDLVPEDRLDRVEALAQIPALIKAYLRLGGFVGEGAFIDRDFNTIDVCLLMDTARMAEKYHAFYTRSFARK
ncbi:GNAT family N-acetyltransferase [Halovulum dunhuangense]|uniref:L-ornithine N(alpha)-acyltransferase n=1 Tax=Halovulum dunhuangense TaxID=1505036 RepID=A0A849L2G6_9RHOB|nr:GNAT family N-acyltransferase [Halovulum dunhuangense]NNU80475.1 GNAT family N-acetyltransferase [Halovulum dunhuangense]